MLPAKHTEHQSRHSKTSQKSITLGPHFHSYEHFNRKTDNSFRWNSPWWVGRFFKHCMAGGGAWRTEERQAVKELATENRGEGQRLRLKWEQKAKMGRVNKCLHSKIYLAFMNISNQIEKSYTMFTTWRRCYYSYDLVLDGIIGSSCTALRFCKQTRSSGSLIHIEIKRGRDRFLVQDRRNSLENSLWMLGNHHLNFSISTISLKAWKRRCCLSPFSEVSFDIWMKNWQSSKLQAGAWVNSLVPSETK